MTDRVRMTVFLETKLHKAARVAAAEEGVPLTELVRRLLIEHVNKSPLAKKAGK